MSSETRAERLMNFYRRMLQLRRFEERSIELYQQGLMGGSLHVGIGQEAVAVGVCAALRPDDYMTNTYRGRPQFLAKGADPGRTMAELLGRRDGYCRGKGGPMHVTAVELGCLGANAIVGAGVPIAVGAALSAKMQGSDRVAVTFFGEGATNQGAWHEAMNLAAVWQAPVVLVLENNQYAEMTPIRRTVRIERLADRATAYGIPAVIVDGMDVEAVHAAAVVAVARARSGGGPTLIEAQTYRFKGHMIGDSEVYRTREEVTEWMARDPLRLSRQKLIELGVAEDALDRAEREVERWIEEAVAFALASPEPTVESAFEDVWVSPSS